ncbi:Cof-type HAD-IIB family hydrolase [Lacticaseibacillus parakribbianus]|uniref:Cof-type HAD-IIB family hydrolase n=1 Tax=Lacticaseibacillus parakribbianus TaxID=2970927 RepID=UPI0021CB4B98|nr:Cof-type HAD-IIB family hydrolase [Lacticaseibacillus parakribbianus]
MYKMIVSDLDESLLQDDGQVSQQDIATIHRLGQAGVKFVPNTGRGFASVQPLLQTLGLAGIAGQYVISYNGGAIVDNAENQILIAHALDSAVADAIYRLAMASGAFCAHIYTMHHVYVVNANPDERAYLKNRGVAYTELAAADLSAFADRRIAKVIFENRDLTRRAALKDAVAKAIETPLTVTYSSNRYVEFNPAGIDKGDAALALGRRIGIAQDEIIALGDNSNDLSMLAKVGLGVAVQNAIPAAKQAAGLVLDATNNDSPVTEIAARLFPDLA